MVDERVLFQSTMDLLIARMDGDGDARVAARRVIGDGSELLAETGSVMWFLCDADAASDMRLSDVVEGEYDLNPRRFVALVGSHAAHLYSVRDRIGTLFRVATRTVGTASVDDLASRHVKCALLSVKAFVDEA